MARLLPASLGARQGTRYIEASGADWSGRSVGRTVVALDPGSDLSDWKRIVWLEKTTGESVSVTTDSMGREDIILESLAERAAQWSRPPRSEPITEVVLDPDLTAHLGRVSGVIDADADGLGDLRSRRTIHEDADRLIAVQKAVKELGYRAFVRRTGLSESVAKRAAAGRPISVRNVGRALKAMAATDQTQRQCAREGCDKPVPQPNATYCEKAHRDQAYRLVRQPSATHTNGKTS
jgi:hypothetical protein